MKNCPPIFQTSLGSAVRVALVAGLALASSQSWGQAPAAEAPAAAPETAKVDTAAANTALSPQLTAFATKFEAENKIKLILIPAGQFLMGDGGRGGTHAVTISRPYLIGATDVTQAQWMAVMGDNPSHFKGDDNRPVERVNWEEAMKFGKKLTEQAAGHLPLGYIFTLPTSAQWEYACRAGTTGDYAGNIAEMGWYDTNADSTTHPVAQKKPNPWGLYDVHGNVWQWVSDWYGNVPNGPEIDPTGPATGSNRVWRGGSWEEGAEYCKSSSRVGDDHLSRFPNLGLRIALVPVPTTPAAGPAPAK